MAANRFFSFSLASISLVLVLAGSTLAADGRPPAFLFDDWARGESGGGEMRMFDRWKSPSGHFSLQYLKSSEDIDAFILVGKNLIDGKEVVLGYGNYSVDVRWISMSAGEVAVVDNGISTGLNELFVVRPLGARGWDLIYKTPLPWAPGGLVVDHCYWSVAGVDNALGSLRLSASWTFSNVTNAASESMVTEATYDIPLFYGFHTAREHDEQLIR